MTFTSSISRGLVDWDRVDALDVEDLGRNNELKNVGQGPLTQL